MSEATEASKVIINEDIIFLEAAQNMLYAIRGLVFTEEASATLAASMENIVTAIRVLEEEMEGV